jgi:hypothetical protein
MHRQAMGLILAYVLIGLAASFALLALVGVLTNEQRLAVSSLVVAIGALALLVTAALDPGAGLKRHSTAVSGVADCHR